MSNRHAFGPREDDWNADFEDPAFGPRSSFDFEDELNTLENNIASFNGLYNGLEPTLFADMMCDGDDLNPGLIDSQIGSFAGENTQHIQTQDISNANITRARLNPLQIPGNSNHGLPPSNQSKIVQDRSYATERFGQVTPPDDKDSSGFKPPIIQPAPEDDIGKLTRQRRARNAANTRHSKSKLAKGDEMESDVERSSNQNRKSSVNLQREKNRVAAAKCRAKKKAGNEQVQEEYQQIAADHSDLTRQERELKNERIQLRNLILAHRPGVCACHGIHRYNDMQAQRLVQGHAAGMNSLPSPSAGSNSITASPNSDLQFDSPLPTPGGQSSVIGEQIHRRDFDDQVNQDGTSHGFVDFLSGHKFHGVS